MKAFLCDTTAYSIMTSVASDPDAKESLLRGCLAIALAVPSKNKPTFGELDSKLTSIADTIRGRVRGSQPQAILAHLIDHLYEDLEFGKEGEQGYNEHYYALNSQYIHSVLETGVGSPALLSAVFCEVARRLGIRAYAASVPGHVYITLESDGAIMYVDPLTGRMVEKDEIQKKMKEFYPDEEWDDEFLNAMDNKMWLTRIMQNIKHIAGRTGNLQLLGAMVELQITLSDFPPLLRDLALIYARMNHNREAIPVLSEYLQQSPTDPQHNDLKRMLGELQKLAA